MHKAIAKAMHKRSLPVDAGLVVKVTSLGSSEWAWNLLSQRGELVELIIP
jgi:hypothetical protein